MNDNSREGFPQKIPENGDSSDRFGPLRRILYGAISRQLSSISEDIEFSEKKRILLDMIQQNATETLPEKAEEIEQLIHNLENSNFQNDFELREALSISLGDFLSKNFSPTELGERFRENLAKQSGWETANRILMFGVYNDEAHLHIAPVFSESAAEVKRLFLEGLRVLANLLKSDSRLQNIRVITGQSWIVYEHHKLLERMGFNITKLDEAEKVGWAEITKEKFIELYG